ncbi:glycophorin-C [Chanos chanos]|uniref:Glycophorin-C n=1 Tax=Chanos chanos TaxID=29144 RepID=A0A6J2WCH8_CHACN|nr:glycophorin-C-like [Chanos chanos]
MIITTAKPFNTSTESQPVDSTNKAEDNGYFDAILGVVITAVVLVLLCLVVVVLRYMYRHKGTYHTNEAKGTEYAETADAALRSDPALQDAMDENKKEYFI